LLSFYFIDITAASAGADRRRAAYSN